jgi:hypothetical protein
MVSVAEYERLNTAEKVRAKMLEQAKRGYWNYGLIPFGYGYDEKKQLLQPDPAEAPIVRFVFEQAAKQVPLNTLVTRLVEKGCRTRVRHWITRHGENSTLGGGFFRSDHLRAMLRNPIYAGRIRFLKEEYLGKHEALVSAELWERANAAVASPKRMQRDVFNTSNVHGYFLKGLLQCSHCNRALMPWTSSPRGKENKIFRYYLCDGHSHARGQGNCPVRSVPARLLESAVVGFIGGIAKHPDLLRRAIEESRIRTQRDRGPMRERLTKLDAEIATLTRQINNCVDAIVRGGTDAIADELRDKARTLKDQKHQLVVQQEQARQELSASEQELLGDDRIRHALGRFGDVFPDLTFPERARLMQLCVDRIDVKRGEGRNQGRLQLALRLPVARLVEGMEERVVIDGRSARATTLERRTLTLPVSIETASNGAAAILQPFGLPLEPGKAQAPAAVRPTCRHPLYQALAWERLRAKQPSITTAEFAKQLGVSAATVDFHAVLLRLAPEIQTFLLKLRDRESIRRYGLMRLQPLARLDHGAQLRQFEVLRTNAGIGAIPPMVQTIDPKVRTRIGQSA